MRNIAKELGQQKRVSRWAFCVILVSMLWFVVVPCHAQSTGSGPVYIGIDALSVHAVDVPRPTAALKLVEDLHMTGNWAGTTWQCHQLLPVFSDFHSYGDGLALAGYGARKIGFLARCGEAAYRSFEGSRKLQDLRHAIDLLAGVGAHPDCWRAAYVLGVAKGVAAESGELDSEESWLLEIDGLWTIWQAAKLLSARGERPYIPHVEDKDTESSLENLCGPRFSLSALEGGDEVSVAGTKLPAGAEMPVTALLMRRLMLSVQRHSDRPGRLLELLPLMRLASDRLRYYHNSDAKPERTATGEIPSRERGDGRGGSADAQTALDPKFDYKNLAGGTGGGTAPATTTSKTDPRDLPHYYRGRALQGSGLFYATYYNDENPAVGVHRLLGLNFAAMYRQEMAKPDSGEGGRDLALAERFHDLGRSCLQTALKNVGRGFGSAADEEGGQDDGEPERKSDSEPLVDRLAKAELHLLLAELDFDYGQARIGKSFDSLRPERRLSMLEAALTNIRAAVKYVEPMGFDVVDEQQDSAASSEPGTAAACVQLPPLEVLKLRIRREYGVILNRLLVVLDTAQDEELLGVTRAQRSKRMADLLVDVQDVPFYYLNKEDHLLLIAPHILARSSGQRDRREGLDVAKRGFDQLIEASLNPILIWALPRRHPSLDGEEWGDESGEPCQIRRISVAPKGRESETSLYSDRCELLGEYLGLLKRTGEYDQLRQTLHFMSAPEFTQEGKRYAVFNLETCKDVVQEFVSSSTGGTR